MGEQKRKVLMMATWMMATTAIREVRRVCMGDFPPRESVSLDAQPEALVETTEAVIQEVLDMDALRNEQQTEKDELVSLRQLVVVCQLRVGEERMVLNESELEAASP